MAVFSYDYFISRSLNLDRGKYKLPPDVNDKMNMIKHKLGIKNFEKLKQDTLKITTLIKPPDNIGNLFKMLNKITDKTYQKLSPEIISLIQSIEETEKISQKFFDILTVNAFYCHLYAKLYKEFTLINAEYITILNNQITQYIQRYDSIIYVSPNEDYDKYCSFVKDVDGIKNITCFLLKCLKYNLLNFDVFYQMINGLQDFYVANIDMEEKLYMNEIYVSNILLIIKETYPNTQTIPEWDSLKRKHHQLLKLNGIGKNKKIHFKLVDISEIFDVKYK